MSSTIIRGGVPSLRLPPSATASAAGPGEASDRAQATRHAARPAADHSWFALFALTRIGAVLAAVALLIADAATASDLGLAAVASGWACATIVAYALRPALQGKLVAWVLDAAAVLALIAASGDWRSAFYLLALTALIFPATARSPSLALAFGVGFTAAYGALAAAAEGGLHWASTAGLETFVAHLLVPLLVVVALAYAAALMRRLRAEQARGNALAVEAERRRIGRELHDSAKQRVHAAGLVLSSLDPAPAVRQATDELECAVADMDASVADPGLPQQERTLSAQLTERVRQLDAVADATVTLEGAAPELPPAVTSDVYRIAAEALTNAARHARASRIETVVAVDDGDLCLTVRDDGRGLPATVRPGTQGLRSMRARARALGADLRIVGGRGGAGTVVELRVPR